MMLENGKQDVFKTAACLWAQLHVAIFFEEMFASTDRVHVRAVAIEETKRHPSELRIQIMLLSPAMIIIKF